MLGEKMVACLQLEVDNNNEDNVISDYENEKKLIQNTSVAYT